MFKPRPLRPREIRNLRHWGMELVVVVVGVLLALWAAEWAETRRGLADAKRASEAIELELLEGAGRTYNFLSVIPCSRRILEKLEVALIRNEPPPMDIVEGSGLPFGLVIPLTLARDEAAASGAMVHVPSQRRIQYGRAYGYLDAISTVTNRLNNRRDIATPLLEGQALSQSERNSMLVELRWMRTQLELLEGTSSVLFEWLEPLQLERYSSELADSRFVDVIPELRKSHGDCVSPPDIAPFVGLVD